MSKKTNSFATRCPHCNKLISFRDQRWELFYDGEENIRSAIIDAAFKYHVGVPDEYTKGHILETQR